ncbi:conserved domain protein [Parvimonas sp. oral taxon 393 str. F0440]|nr:conserved domain protein [Parvimonas sp. oral taxon 393 str. F0440]
MKVFNAKDLKLEKTIDTGNDYVKMYNLTGEILLVKKTGYVLVDKSSFSMKEFSEDIIDSIKSEDSVYLILKDRYKKIK